MRRRTVIQRILGSLLVAAACHDSTAPATLPTCHSSSASQLTLAVAAYTAIDPATDAGCVTFVANTSTLQAEYLIVPQSAAGTWGLSSTFSLANATLAPTAMPAAQRLAPPASPGTRGLARDFDAFMRRRGAVHAARALTPLASAPAPATPPLVTQPPVGNLRTFAVCASLDCSRFQKVVGRVIEDSVPGGHVAIYVDTTWHDTLTTPEMDSLRRVFDTRLYTIDTSTFGSVTDLDTNGVVIALMTPVVNALVSQSLCTSSGYIAGFFFPDDLILSVPIDSSNHGEIFYSIVPDPAAKVSCAHSATNVMHVTPGTFMHEFQHMINFAQHVLIKSGTATEDGWLDEGLSKYAEELAGRSFLLPTCQNYPGTTCPDTVTFSRYAINNVYDAYQYLNATGGSPLLIQYDQGTLAEVGASWLFVRYVVDQFGATLPGKLDQTTLVGSANVAAQTGQSFTTIVTRWALSNWVSDLPGFAAPAELRDTSWHFRTRTFPSLHQQDSIYFPLPFPLVPSQYASGSVTSSGGTLRSGSGVYLRVLQDPGAPAFTLVFSGPSATFTSVVPRLNVIRIR